MKKIVIVLFIITLLVIFSTSEEKVIIPDNAIRFRIIANSNNLSDQEEKIRIMLQEGVPQIKIELEPVISDILNKSNNIEESRLNIKSNIKNINNIIYKYNTNYKVNYGINHFPEKTYKGVTYKSGDYESLVVTLGDGLGDNWWCVLFPPLCLIEASEEDYDEITYTSYIKELIAKSN